jgi:diguanylate cyclase (GGDEF)-like protein
MKLSLKLALYIALLAIIGSTVLSFYSYLSTRNYVDKQARNSVRAMIETVYNMAATSAYVNDEALAYEVISGLRNNAEISCAVLQTATMSVKDQHQCQGQALTPRQLYSPWDENEQVGSLIVFLNTEHVEQRVKTQVRQELRNVIGIVIFISLSIALLTYTLLTKPLSKLSRNLREIDFKKNIDLLEEALRGDEIGEISKVINRLLINAQKQIVIEQQLGLKTEQLTRDFKLIFELSKNALAVTNEQLQLHSYNPRFAQLVNYSKDIKTLVGTSDWLDCISDKYEDLKKIILNHSEFNKPHTVEIEVNYHNGAELVHNFFSLTFIKASDRDDSFNILIFVNDVTDQRMRLLETEYAANHDNLTKLLNRGAATQKIRYQLTESDWAENKVAIMVIDLDGFKSVNDEYGHDAGDEVLRKTSSRLQKSLRKSDIISRWGGDEFLVSVADVNQASAINMANKILASLSEPIDYQGIELKIGASIGVALASDKVSDFQSLFDRADQAMYKVKKSGKSAVMLYSNY